jgi:hypothetical protein
MKITVLSMTEHKIEVDDRFAPLAHNHPNHIFYPESEGLLNELESEIFSQIHLSFVDEKGLNANTPTITNIDTADGGTIFEW